MSKPVRDYAVLAENIKNAVKEDNIINATHCATRLRLVLKETPSEEVKNEISRMTGVIQVVEKGGQFQIVIGTHAKDVYEELAKLISVSGETEQAKQSIFNRIIAAMSAVFAPFVYILAASGLVQGALILISLIYPAFAETGTYSVLSFISWTPFTFLPVMIAVTASKHFKCNTFLAMWCCLALVNPSWTEMAARIAEGESIRFLIFNLSQTKYTSTVLPALLLVFALSYLEKFLEKHIPDLLKAIFVPFICAVIMVPLTILVIGPVSETLAGFMATGFNYLVNHVPVVASAIVGAFWQVLVVFGIHWGITPMKIANFANNGCDAFTVYQTCSVIAQMAACFGVYLKSKDKEIKNVAVSAGMTGIFGITEPAIYGVTLRLKKPFVIGCIGGAVGAVVSSLFGTMYYSYSNLPGILTLINTMSSEHSSSFIGMVVGAAVTIVVTIVLIQIIGCDDKDTTQLLEKQEESLEETESSMKEMDVYSPLKGEVRPLNEVNDPTFANELLGKGVAVIPEEGKLYAPFDGKVEMIFDTKHAIALKKGTMELIIHVGLDTVNLNGKYFTPKVQAGDSIRKGQLLMEFSLEDLKKEGFDTITPIIVTNSGDFTSIEPDFSDKNVDINHCILTVQK